MSAHDPQAVAELHPDWARDSSSSSKEKVLAAAMAVRSIMRRDRANPITGNHLMADPFSQISRNPIAVRILPTAPRLYPFVSARPNPYSSRRWRAWSGCREDASPGRLPIVFNLRTMTYSGGAESMTVSPLEPAPGT